LIKENVNLKNVEVSSKLEQLVVETGIKSPKITRQTFPLVRKNSFLRLFNGFFYMAS